MKVLLVDDQKAIVESMNKGVRWKQIGIEEVFTAYSAAEAKLLLVNMPIDIMLCDIEMPGEDGLSLVRWTRDKNIKVYCIFLTAHAEFEYAQKAIGLGGHDYILQPARYSDVEAAVEKAYKYICEERKVKKITEMQIELVEQRDIFLTAMIKQLYQGDWEGAENILRKLIRFLQMEPEETVVCAVQGFIRKAEEYADWATELKMMLTRNVLEELFKEENVKVCVTIGGDNTQSILMLASHLEIDVDKWKRKLEMFYDFMRDSLKVRMDMLVENIPANLKTIGGNKLFSSFLLNADSIDLEAKGVIWREKKDYIDDSDVRIAKVLEYIRTHIYKNISRAEAANLVYLNEEYFSRVFRKYTGWTFKNYVLKEKMRVAGQLLTNSNLPIMVIASKLGFDNFSHFSQTFKKIADITPQEYRRLHQKRSENEEKE